MKTKMICIMCPMGCELDVEKIGQDIKVSGNNCIRGEKYAIAELTEPMRVLTSVIRTKSGVVSVKTDKPIPKKLLNDAVLEISKIKADKLNYGDIVIPNILGTDANVIVTREAVIEKK